MRLRCMPILPVLLGITVTASATDRAAYTLKLQFEGRQLEGLPLAWSSDNVVLLERDGRLMDVDPRRVQQFQSEPPRDR